MTAFDLERFNDRAKRLQERYRQGRIRHTREWFESEYRSLRQSPDNSSNQELVKIISDCVLST
jgi:hypothetical protein